MKYKDKEELIDGVKYMILEMRKPRKAERTWKTETGHIYNYSGIGGRGRRKGESTKTNTHAIAIGG